MMLEEARTFAGREHRLYLGGRWVDGPEGKTLETHDPSTGLHLSKVPAAGSSELDSAVRAARQAVDGGEWSRLTPADRQKVIWRLGDLMVEHADELAALESLDTGKPLRDSRFFDVLNAASSFHYCAGWATKLNGETIGVSRPGEWHAYTVHEPVGVVAAIVPWNAPLMIASAKVAPALAAGCSVVLKPAEETPLTALRLAELSLEAGLPAGALNVLTGTGPELGDAMVRHPGIDKVAFTGSTEVGRHIVRQAADSFKRVSLELGGKSPVIVLSDADLDRATPLVAQGIFANTGQACNAGSRLFAESAVFDRVVEGVAEYAAQLRVGQAFSEETQMGPLISQVQLDRVAGYVDIGLSEGADIRVGGKVLERDGYFIEPTVLSGTRTEMRVAREEIFGPVLCAMSVTGDDLDDIVAEANATNYGLGASVWTRDLGKAHRIARRLKAGTVRINGGGLDPALPFGGYKESGWGRESGLQGVQEYTELKSVMISLGEV
ncbi:aldehyde dehydrogenase [Amycolatopsis sp. GM8]|uniref:aldehyde dehydrogenase family protein n=1 Tax=Amycolatopsis sp. GM8 TaxID=2896530 RepID=UPI001F1F508A|nr:aldehyde dehydrogenase family protein [Amycolatopsis sp. GM8]